MTKVEDRCPPSFAKAVRGMLLGIACSLCAMAAEPAPVSPTSAVLPPISFYNIAEVIPAGGTEGFRLSRVPESVRKRLEPGAQLRAFSPAGAELRFNLIGAKARLTLRFVEDRAARTRGAPVLIEIRSGDHLVRTRVLQETWTDIEITRPANLQLMSSAGAGKERFDPALVRVLLPFAVETRLLKIEGAVSPARPDQVPTIRYLAYGSSITHGYDSVHPSETYPARVARIRGVDHFNLGFGGAAHLEPAMADWIAARTDWDFASLELGVNLLSRTSEEEFRKRVRYFLATIATAHPEKWIFVIDIFRSQRDLTRDPKQQAFRAIVSECVREIGSPKVVHLDGRELLTDGRGLTTDLLHPSPEGFAEIATRLARAMACMPSPEQRTESLQSPVSPTPHE